MGVKYLSSQTSNIIEKLHHLFEEIGIPCQERETRESELFAALTETLNNSVRLVTSEKHALVEEAQHIIKTIKQMEASLEDRKSPVDHGDENIKITYPLMQCLKELKKKHFQISKLHKERFEEVKKLVQALKSYSSYIEPSFTQLTLPPTSPSASIPPTFDLSPTYVLSLEKEFDRVYQEYSKRVSIVRSLCENIIHLWAELGIPQAQTDGMIVEHYKDSPEKLGLLEEDMTRLRAKRDTLMDEKKRREKQLRDLSESVQSLWDRLGIEDQHKKNFLKKSRGCGIRQINEFEDELSRLNDLKRQNLDLFVEEARCKLQELWDSLYFSEEEMLDFTPAFSDVYSDALLEAHEQEISRLKVLKEQRDPILVLLGKHRALINDRDALQASSQDASRLLGRGQKGEKRDPTRLLREEKMRKRISKELPRITMELRRDLEKWENDFGRPFLVHGEPYLDLLMEEMKTTPGPRSKTPAGPPISANKNLEGTLTRPNSVTKVPQSLAPSRAGAKTPATSTSVRYRGILNTTTKSPSKIPARAPLSNLNFENSLDRKVTSSLTEECESKKKKAMSQPPPPKMRDINMDPPSLNLNSRAESVVSNSSLRQVTSEDTHYDNSRYKELRLPLQSTFEHKASLRHNEHTPSTDIYSRRQLSSASNTTVSGSENWQTIEDDSEPEQDVIDSYYAKVYGAHGKRFIPNDYPSASQSKKQKPTVTSSTIRQEYADTVTNIPTSNP